MSYQRILIGLAKIAFSASAMYLVFSHVDMADIVSHAKELRPGYVLLGFLALNMAQFLSGQRMRYYFASEGLRLKRYYSSALYYIGTFFNLMLPGGIGGDGYIAYLMKSRHKLPLKKGIALMLSGRASGLLWLMLISFGLALASPYVRSTVPFAAFLLVLGMAITIAAYALGARYLLRESYSVQLGAAPYSFGLQSLVMITALCLFMALAHHDWMFQSKCVDYLLLFMISCVVSVLPISVGGVGLRELTFVYGAKFLALDQEVGVTVALAFFIINLVASCLGALFLVTLDHKKGKEYGRA